MCDEAINWTIVELKLGNIPHPWIGDSPINWTIVELKLRITEEQAKKLRLLIEL